MTDKNKKLAELLFPHITKTKDYYETLYKSRNLQQGAEVTRFAPSPTGYMHIGNFFSALLDRSAATQTAGSFFLRVEDTDQKREIKGATDVILEVLNKFGIKVDEGAIGENGSDIGEYGPYTQSKRKEIYQTYAKFLVEKGRAYPCFCSDEKLEEQKQAQKAAKVPTGYYNEHAICRNLSLEEVQENLNKGKQFVLRLKSEGTFPVTHKRVFVDQIKGKRIFPKNYRDAIILKSNGIPPYNLAHAVDDHLMGTTLVIRGEEWFPSLAEHLELFEALEFEFVKYAHNPLIQILDDGKKRKISKRKDPEADMRYYLENGYLKETIIEYLLTLANSNFEPWRTNNPSEHYSKFPFTVQNIGSSSPLFDNDKLNNIGKNHIANLSVEAFYDNLLLWAKEYDKQFYTLLTTKKDYALSVFHIERDNEKKRKDIYNFKMVYDFYKFMFEAPNQINWAQLKPNYEPELIKSILTAYIKVYDQKDDKQTWFNKIKDLSPQFGFSREVKEFKKNPEQYLGHCGDVSTLIRIAITGRTQTPDLYEICQVLGQDEVMLRLQNAIK
jgi:glutamyl-tRNA synthetase